MQPLPTLALVVLLALAAPAHAESADADDYLNPDRPGIADGSNVVGAGRVQVEAGLQREYRNDAGIQTRTLFVPTLLRFGLNKDLELRIEGNTYTWSKESSPGRGVARSEGLAATSIGFKYHFVDGDDSQLPSLGAIVRLFPRTGSGGLRPAHTTGDLRIAADWDLAPGWSLNPNVGVGLFEDDGQRLFRSALVAATLSYSPSRALSLFVDASLQYPEKKQGRAAAIVDVGVAYLIGREIQLDFSVGSRTAGTTPPRPFFSAGISKRY